MKGSLGRLLRLRELVEDRARLELERNAAEMRALEESVDRQRQMVQRIRDDAVTDLTGLGNRPEEWRLKIDDAALTGKRTARLAAHAEARKPVVDRARQELVERRRERRQVEMLQAATARKEEVRHRRQDQNRTDEWFQSRPKAGKK